MVRDSVDDARYMTLTLIFNPERDRVLMCYHAKQCAYNFIGGKSKVGEEYMDTAVRELHEETGITAEDVDLKLVRLEQVSCMVPGYNPAWTVHVTAGILKHEVTTFSERNDLVWVPVTAHYVFQYLSYGNGNCFTFLREAGLILGIDIIGEHHL